jgi:5-methylcytosine-specific restriction endonuclease McrA
VRRAYRARQRAAWVEDVHAWTLFERDGWLCQLCNEPIDPTLPRTHPRGASVDHVLPLALGGLHCYANTQASHLRCNTRKAHRVHRGATVKTAA